MFCLSSKMNVMLSLCLWFALMLSSCCGDAGSHEEETATADYDFQTATTEDYDYNATFDYYYITAKYPEHVYNKASWISGFSPVLLLGLAVYHIWN